MKELFVPAEDGLAEDHARWRALCNHADHNQFIVIMARFDVIGLHPRDRKNSPRFGFERALIDTQLAHPFAAPAFNELQVIGIIDETRKICVLIINTNRKSVGGHCIVSCACIRAARRSAWLVSSALAGNTGS